MPNVKKSSVVKYMAASALVLAGLLVFSVASAFGQGITRSQIILYLTGSCLLVVLIALCVRFYRMLAVRDLFSPAIAFPCAYVVWFLIGSIDFLDVPSTFSFGLMDPIPPAIWGYSALGLLGYLIGVFITSKYKGQTSNSKARNHWDRTRVVAAISVLVLLSALSWIYIVASMGIPALSADAGELRLRITKYGYTQMIMILSTWTIVPWLAAELWSRRLSARQLVFGWVTIGLCGLLMVSFAGRGYLVIPLVTAVVARNYIKARWKPKVLAVSAICLFCLISASGFLRDTALSAGPEENGLSTLGIPSPILPIVYSYLYFRFPVATFRDLTEIIPHKVPFQTGKITLLPFMTVMPGHHEMSDIVFKNLLGNDFIGAGQPATMLAPLYADFGGPGIFVGMFLFGVLVNCVYRWMRRDCSCFRVLIYAWLLQTAFFGLYANLFPYLTTLLIPLFWVLINNFVRDSTNEGSLPTVEYRGI